MAGDAEQVSVDFSQWTISEWEAFEEASGSTFGDVMLRGCRSIREVKAAAWVQLRRDDPAVELADLDARLPETIERVG